MPLQPTLTLRTTAHENSQGRRYLSYTPVCFPDFCFSLSAIGFTPDCTARGSCAFSPLPSNFSFLLSRFLLFPIGYWLC